MDLQATSVASAVSGNDPFLLDWERKRGAKAATRGVDDVESQYKRIYEDRVNPFTDFNRYGQERVWPPPNTVLCSRVPSVSLCVSRRHLTALVVLYVFFCLCWRQAGAAEAVHQPVCRGEDHPQLHQIFRVEQDRADVRVLLRRRVALPSVCDTVPFHTRVPPRGVLKN